MKSTEETKKFLNTVLDSIESIRIGLELNNCIDTTEKELYNLHNEVYDFLQNIDKSVAKNGCTGVLEHNTMKMFPIINHLYPPVMYKTIDSIPWEMIAPHEKQALKTHGQNLQRLAERGGLSANEAISILEGKNLLHTNEFLQDELAFAKLIDMVTEWHKNNPIAIGSVPHDLTPEEAQEIIDIANGPPTIKFTPLRIPLAKDRSILLKNGTNWGDVICSECEKRADFHCNDDGFGGFENTCGYSNVQIIARELENAEKGHALCNEELIRITEALIDWADEANDDIKSNIDYILNGPAPQLGDYGYEVNY